MKDNCFTEFCCWLEFLKIYSDSFYVPEYGLPWYMFPENLKRTHILCFGVECSINVYEVNLVNSVHTFITLLISCLLVLLILDRGVLTLLTIIRDFVYSSLQFSQVLLHVFLNLVIRYINMYSWFIDSFKW